MKTYANPVYASARAPELDGVSRQWPVIVVGAGPVGLVAAIDLAARGIEVLILDDDHTVSTGSRAICWSKRTLEILDRLGCGERIAARGVQWNRGRVFFRDDEVYAFDLLGELGNRRPAFVNLQQYWVEQMLVERAGESPSITLRWRSRVVSVTQDAKGIVAEIASPEGNYLVRGQWLIAADGARSAIRGLLGLDMEGQAFRDRFLIADVHMSSSFPAERWFWFDPPFHRHQSALLHRQADDVWRIDFQLGWDADPEEEKRPENILPRLRAMLGNGCQFEIEWASVYTFQCRRMRSFVHGRAIFAGDAAHVVSPFGARGANSGIQDVDNLAWKLALVLEGRAPAQLIASYDAERTLAADANILHSTRSTDFITPKSCMSRAFRDATLMLARRHPFARRLINSGRLSLPAVLADSPLNSADTDVFEAGVAIGAVAVDAPVEGPHGSWLLGYLGATFTLLTFGNAATQDAIRVLAAQSPACDVLQVGGEAVSTAHRVEDVDGLVVRRYDGRPGTCYLFRPDQHVCARWRSFDLGRVRAALDRAVARPRELADVEEAA